MSFTWEWILSFLFLIIAISVVAFLRFFLKKGQQQKEAPTKGAAEFKKTAKDFLHKESIKNVQILKTKVMRKARSAEITSFYLYFQYHNLQTEDIKEELLLVQFQKSTKNSSVQKNVTKVLNKRESIFKKIAGIK